MKIVGIDVGGTGIKAALVDTEAGTLVGERRRVLTPQPATPAAVANATALLVEELPVAAAGIGFPAAVRHGKTVTAANIDPAWIGVQADELFADTLGRSVAIGNDADAAGLAEVRFGAGRDVSGTVLMLTLGTGIGSALFIDGRLVPNTELGHIEIRGKDAEHRAAASVKERKNLSWHAFAKRLSEVVERVDALLWPDLVIIGGGISKDAHKFIRELPCRANCVPATLHNEAGIVGAAMLAAESSVLRVPREQVGSQ